MIEKRFLIEARNGEAKFNQKYVHVSEKMNE